MKRVLFISYHFPPIGGAGAQRPLSLARNLEQFGYHAAVVSGPAAESQRWTPPDTSLARDLSGLEVHRVPGPEPLHSVGWPRRRERWLGRPSPWVKWWLSRATALGMEIGADTQAIYTWSQPYTCVTVGARLADALRKPWVADLGDPWALDEMNVYPTALHRKRDLRQMRQLLRGAAAIVMSTPEAVRRMRDAFPDFESKPIIASPVGFDGRDFASAPAETRHRTFRIVHTGYLHTEDGLRLQRQAGFRKLVDPTYPVDMLTRSHVYLLQAVELLISSGEAAPNEIEVHLLGVLSEVDRQVAQPYPFVRSHGYTPHDDTVQMMQSADLLFLPMHDVPPGSRAGLVPGKTYEYLAARTPILAAVPPGDAMDLLTEAGNAHICPPSDVSAMARAIKEELARWRSRRPAKRPKEDVVRRYERVNQARQVAELFDSVITAGASGRAADALSIP